MKLINFFFYFSNLSLNFLFLLLIFSLSFLFPYQIIVGQRIPLTDFLFLLLIINWLILLVFRQTSLHWHKVFWLLLIYLTAFFISIFVSADKDKSFIKFFGIIYLVGLAVLTFNIVKSTEFLRKVLLVWLLGTFIVCLIGLVSIFLFYFQPDNWLLRFTVYHFGAVPVGNYPRISSTFVSASMFCNYLSVSLAFLLISRKNNWINFSNFSVLLAIILINAIFTISSGLGGIVLILCVWFWFSYKDLFPKMSAFSLIFGLCFSIAFFIVNLIALQKYSSASFSFTFPFFEKTFYPSSRFLIWRDSLQTFFENPIFGVGIGQDSNRILFQNTDGTNSLLTDAHNIYLSVATQTGVLGLIALLFLIYFLIREFVSTKPETCKISTIRFGLGLAFVSAFIYQGFLGSFEDSRYIWVLIGLILSFGTTNFNKIRSI